MSVVYDLRLPILLERLREILPRDTAIYLVGGAVRDALVGKRSIDLDFVLPDDALAIARRVADALDGAYYRLNDAHSTGRVVLQQSDDTRHILDFSNFRGPDLESDLRGRDFTINAMAVDLHNPTLLIDPMGGVQDLYKGQIRACSPAAFVDDPLRILRAIRMAVSFDAVILPETLAQMRLSNQQLSAVSFERIRDELFRILEGPKPDAALRTLDRLGTLSILFPELVRLREVAQSAPHSEDVWSHTLHTLHKLSLLISVLGPDHDSEATAELILGSVAHRLGRYRFQLTEHLNTRLNPSRSMRSLLFLAALYHDVGKQNTRQEDESGRIRFLGHEQVGATLAGDRARQLCLSNQEVKRLVVIVKHHMRPLLLAQPGKHPSRRAIYRYFRDTHEAGVDICLLSLADTLATYGPGLPQEVWVSHLDVTRALFDAWWQTPTTSVSPPILVTGEDLLEELLLQPGPQVGSLLERIREGQASGQIRTRQQAISAARQWLMEDE